ncbi:MAG: bifunctional 5,10-methylene-tetrahydrofolate dehydrogenase/5,10-methylene-tetrahydrofolate cyclohydrolase [Firmicutes bacterium]|nr:bifunctional 5,10-methylene-tetrahydrofolate dehydrogenase/5,10-methylene-tetrahydrofolate cyclohydrolase [Bacillota bacterium]
MITLLKGAPAGAALREKASAMIEALKEKGVTPGLAVVRVGEEAGDLSYEKAIYKRCGAMGIEVRTYAFCGPTDGELQAQIRALNADPSVHGILMMRPLPKGLDEAAARELIAPEKDVDGCGSASLAGVFTGSGTGFCPCTAQAAVEILDQCGVEIAGKKAAVIGRSLVIGRPAAMLLLHRNATVTLCHSRTADLREAVRGADIVIAATGRPESLDSSFFRSGQTVIDVGASWSEAKGKICGDVDMDSLIAADENGGLDINVTPVPGGVGAVTTSVLALHVAEAAARQNP